MSEKLDKRPYSDAEVSASIRSLQRWRDSNGDDYPFVVGAVLPVLDALERFAPSSLMAALEAPGGDRSGYNVSSGRKDEGEE